MKQGIFLGTMLWLAVASAWASEAGRMEVGLRPAGVTRGFGGRYYVSVMNGSEPGYGAVRVVEGGQVRDFATGLDEPKGIAFTGKFLVVTDVRRVWKIDAEGRKTVLAGEGNFPGRIQSLHGASAAPDGQGVYVTDIGAQDRMMGPEGLWPMGSREAAALPAIGQVFRVGMDGKVTLEVRSAPGMPCPAAVCSLGDRRQLILDFFTGNLLSAWRGRTTLLHTGFRGGSGVARDSRGHMYVSSWTMGKVWRIDRDGSADSPRVLLQGLRSAGDFYVDESAGLLVVTDMIDGAVVTVPLD